MSEATCVCGHQYRDHYQESGDVANWCEITGCNCGDFKPMNQELCVCGHVALHHVNLRGWCGCGGCQCIAFKTPQEADSDIAIASDDSKSDSELQALCSTLIEAGSGGYYLGEPPCENATTAAKALLKKIQADRWTPVAERLPEVRKVVMVYMKTASGGFVYMSNRNSEGLWMAGWEVTHWRPLPEPPK